MSQIPDVLCLNISQSLKRFDRPLLEALSEDAVVAQWEYIQSLDEPCSLDTALVLLHDYLKHCDRPVHLLGHGISGALGLLYARRHPNRVRSLTLLSVGAHPLVDWHAHYYVHRQILNCSRSMILAQVVTNLFGSQSRAMTQRLMAILDKDLDTSPSPHSLCRRVSLPPGGVSVPLLVARGEYDLVVDPNEHERWQPCLKAGDRLWECADGWHFFHYFQPELVAEQISGFWNSLATPERLTCTATAST